MGEKLGTIKGKVRWNNKDKTVAREAKVYAVSGKTQKIVQVDEKGEFVLDNLSPENPWTLFPMHYDGKSVKSISKEFKIPEEPEESEADTDDVASGGANEPAAEKDNSPDDAKDVDPEDVDQSMTLSVELVLNRTVGENAPFWGGATVFAFVLIGILLLTNYWKAHQQEGMQNTRNRVIAALQSSQDLIEQIQAGNTTEFKKFSGDLNNLLNEINSGRRFIETEKEVNIRNALKSLQARLDKNVPSMEITDRIADKSQTTANAATPANDKAGDKVAAAATANEALATESDTQEDADAKADAAAGDDATRKEPAKDPTVAAAEEENAAKVPLKEEVAKLRGMVETLEAPYLWTAWPWLLVELWCWGLLGVLVQKVVRLSWYLRIKRYYADGTLMHWAQVLTTPILAVIGTMLISVVQIKTGGGGTIGLTSVQAMVVASFLLSLNPWGLWDFMIAKGKGLMDGN